MPKPLLIVIGGPTAVGKTALAIELARKFHTEIISADSRQIYRELDIAVAKPRKEELAAVKHHFISTVSINENYNAGKFAADALAAINDLFKMKKTLILVGGSGLYIRALIQGLDQLPESNPTLRAELQEIFEQNGIESLRERYLSQNPKEPIKELQNPQRLIRAIELLESNHKESKHSEKVELPFDFVCYYLNMDRKMLYERINNRVDRMMEKGLLNEARKLYDKKSLNALQTVGYRELFNYLDGNGSLDQAIDKIKQNSRNYAKRQITWFKNDQSFTEVFGINDLLTDLSNKGLFINTD